MTEERQIFLEECMKGSLTLTFNHERYPVYTWTSVPNKNWSIELDGVTHKWSDIENEEVTNAYKIKVTEPEYNEETEELTYKEVTKWFSNKNNKEIHPKYNSELKTYYVEGRETKLLNLNMYIDDEDAEYIKELWKNKTND